jgi:hypothetical protein
VSLKMWQVGSSGRSVIDRIFEIENMGGMDKQSKSILIVWNSCMVNYESNCD